MTNFSSTDQTKMATLQSLLATSLSPSQDQYISQNAPHAIELLLSGRLLEDADEATIHKFKLRVSALLKSKTPIARWFGAYLAKIACQTNFAVLKEHGGTWAGLLIHILEIPSEAVVTHEIAVEALSKIFEQTWGKQELTRDITTPRLPQYIKQLLKLAEGTKEEGFVSPLTGVIVPALNKVMKQQSTTFKPHAPRYQRLLQKLISSAYTSAHKVNMTVLSQVCEGYVLLHYATVKGNEPVVWRELLNKVVAEIHATVSQLADQFVEEDGSLLGDSTMERLEIAEVSISEGLNQIKDKLRVLFVLLEKFFVTSTKGEVKLPLGAIANLADRLFSLNKHTIQKRAVEKAARGIFLSVIDEIHIATASFALKIIPVAHTMILVHIEAFMHHIDVLSDTTNSDVLEQLLKLAASFFELIGVLPKAMLPLVTKLVTASLALLEPRIDKSSLALSDSMSSPSLFLVNPSSTIISTVTTFFATVIVTVPDLALPIRSRIDQYLILTSLKHNGATSTVQRTLALSALHPGRASKYSILPMALRAVPQNEILESLVHPRLPPLNKAIHNLEKGSSLNATSTRQDVEEYVELAAKRKHSEDDKEEAENDGNHIEFIAKRAKSAETTEVTETPAAVETQVEVEAVDVKLQFETVSETAIETKSVIKTTNEVTSITEKPKSPSSEDVPTTVASFGQPTRLSARASTPPGTLAAPSDDDDDEEDIEMPMISLESSDDEE